MPSNASSSNFKREEGDTSLMSIPPSTGTIVQPESSAGSYVKTEPKEEGQDDKFTLSRQVIYLWIANFGRYCWHLIGDGSKFQVGFTTDSNHIDLLQCSTITLPNPIGHREAIFKLMPAPKEPFWNASQPIPQARNQMRKTVVDCILEVRLVCGYADAQFALRWRARDTPYKPVRLPDGVDVDLEQCLSQGLQDRSLNIRQGL